MSGSAFTVAGDDTRVLEFERQDGALELITRFQDGRITRTSKETPAC